MNPAPVLTIEQLDATRERSEEHFRQGRGMEPLAVYLDLFDEYQGDIENFLSTTADLTQLADHAIEILTDPRGMEIFRYIAGPPISEDDLKVLMRTTTLSTKRLIADTDLITRLVNFLRDWHDRRRFVWLAEDRVATERERQGAVLASASLLAMRRVETLRRNDGKRLQEQLVVTQLQRVDFVQVPTRKIRNLNQAPRPGSFCRESMLGTRKADIIVGLWDGRIMAIECKVSNSATNSIKRLNNDAAVKARVWIEDFGTRQVVPAAVLSGVFGLHNLQEAQDRGLTLFWAHDLAPMLAWIRETLPRRA